MTYIVKPSKRFQRDLKKIKARGYDLSLIATVIKKLANGEALEPKYKDHALAGDYQGSRECHISSDWLLIYEIEDKALYLYLSRTGTHSDLF